MSIASISYDSLADASNEAKHIAKRLDNYADSINRSVYKKLNKYSGPRSSNISTASNNINLKISELRSQSEQYEKYATSLSNLEKECRSTDKSVRSKVSTLTAAFKKNHGIKDSKIVNTVNYFFTSIGNSSAFRRWLGDGKDLSDAGDDYFKQKIKDWYNYEGGKDFIKGTLVAALEIAIAVVTVLAAIATLGAGGALVAMIVAGASLIVGVIAGINGFANLVNEGRALYFTMHGDEDHRDGNPAKGKRRSSEDTIQDTLRTETDSRFLHNVATGIDVVNFTCTVVTAVSSVVKLKNNGIKWATGGASNLNNMKRKDIFKAFTGKLKISLSEAWTKISYPIKVGDWTAAKSYLWDAALDFKTDFLENLQDRFWKGDDGPKNLLSSFKDIVDEGLNFKNLKNIALPCITVANLPGGEKIKIGDFTDIFSDFDFSKFSGNPPMPNDVLDKLSKCSDINISIPDIHMPEIKIDLPNIKVA